jgi:putative transposase
MVSRPEAYPWSSYSSNAMGMPDGLLMRHELYMSLGDSPRSRQDRWREFCGQDVTERHLEEIRKAVHFGRPLAKAELQPVTA